ncbi:hypothetical protein [Methylocystis iwaonis]|uniref:hypothetical protein n=1 Tax=Methylocystis iwaonis TaxID=2885079 RepID=UPI002E7BD0BF|nr:hypothetical protein [Methylocystis iwaonis]
MTHRLSFLRPAAASRLARALLLAAALVTGVPFAASLAMGLRAGAGAVASLFVCFASGASLPDAQTGRPGSVSDHGIDCVLCQTLCSGAAPLAVRPGVVVAAHIQRLNLPWMVADRAAPTTRTRLPHWARAPPATG